MAQTITNKTPLEIAKEKYDVALKNANDAIAKKDANAYNEAMLALANAEDEYTKLSANAMYDEYASKENPIVEIVKAYAYKTVGHKEKRNKDDNDRVVSVDPVERERQIDLLAFCKRAKLDTDWQYVASKCNQLMCLRAATQLGVDNVKDIAKSYFLQDKAKQIEMGKTPTSNTQVCKLLQSVIDEILPNDNPDGKTYKCNNYDVAYLDDLYGKKSGKQRITVRVSNDSFFRRILVDICYRLVTNSKYGIDGYREVKNS